ncbi:MAG TPA: MTH938/NDUFAF3 family protein [Edaphobacter sp.]
MHFSKFSFGTLQIDGSTYTHDVVIERGEVRKRKKAPSQRFRDEFGHTPLSLEEKIPWKCKQLVIGTGAYGQLPVMKEVKREAERRHVELVIVPTSEALRLVEKKSEANAILHVTC